MLNREFLPLTYPVGKMIDFYVAIDPNWTPGHANISENANISNVANTYITETQTAAAVRRFKSPQLTINHATETEAVTTVRLFKSIQYNRSINHTDHLPFTKYPIALSIKFKRSDGNAVKSETQLGV